MDGQLFRVGIFVLHDGVHLTAGAAHDAAIASRVGKVDGQQRQLFAVTHMKQGLQRVGLRQRHITRQHHHHAVISQ